MKLTLLPLQNDELVRVRCDGPMSIDSRGPHDEPLRELLGPYCFTLKVLLDLEKVQTVDTAGLSWLLRDHKKFQESGGKLILYNVPPIVTQVLDFLRLTPHLPIAPTEEAAREMALGEPAALAHEGGPRPASNLPVHSASVQGPE